MSDKADKPRVRVNYTGQGLMKNQVQQKYTQKKVAVSKKSRKKMMDRYIYLLKKEKLKTISWAESREKKKLEKKVK